MILKAKITIPDYSTMTHHKRLSNITIQKYFPARYTFLPESKSILIAGLEALRKGLTAVREATGTAGHGSETPILT